MGGQRIAQLGVVESTSRRLGPSLALEMAVHGRTMHTESFGELGYTGAGFVGAAHLLNLGLAHPTVSTPDTPPDRATTTRGNRREWVRKLCTKGHRGGLVEFDGFSRRNRPGFCRSRIESLELRRRLTGEDGGTCHWVGWPSGRRYHDRRRSRRGRWQGRTRSSLGKLEIAMGKLSVRRARP